jgi:hypothetical protein
MSERQAAFGIFIGTNGTGKTSRMKELLPANARNLIIPSGRDDVAWRGLPELTWNAAWIEDEMKPGKKVNAVQVAELNTFTGNRLFQVDGKPILFDAIAHRQTGFRNGGLFMDDYKNYLFSRGSMRQEVDGLFINRRHKMLDIFMACHGFEDVNRDLLRFNPTLFLFRTTLPPTDASIDKMANADAFLATVARVNQRAQANPYYFEKFQPAM